MKYLLISIINLYQKLPLSSHKQCRFIPSCSNYSKEAIMTYGVFKGSILSIKRILKCNPFSSYGYDPLPQRRKK